MPETVMAGTAPAGTALVIGQGSIGQRHARVLAGLGLTVGTLSRRGGPAGFATLDEALTVLAPGYVVIATETADHGRVLEDLAGHGHRGRVLVEKPLFAAPQPVPAQGFAGLAVGYQLRCHPALARLRRLLDGERVLSAQIYVGQYLPEWRPDRDYRDGYSGRAAEGGGVLRDLSHELDLANWLFGPWRRLTALGGHWSHLEIDSDDHFLLLAAFERCPAATLQLNYLDRRTRREVVVNTDRATFTLDLIAGTLCRDRDEPETFAVDRDQVLRAMHRSVLDGPADDLCDLDQGLRVVAMIAAAERAAAEGIWVEAAEPPNRRG